MKTSNIFAYELLIKQLLYQNRTLKTSSTYVVGRYLMLCIEFLKRGNLIGLFRRIRNSLYFTRLLRRFTDLPRSELKCPSNQIPLLHVSSKTPSVTVYTCITGQYDVPLSPLVHYSNCRYLLFSDTPKTIPSNNGWEVCSLPECASVYGMPAKINRFLKFHPKEICQTDYAIYIDGNIRLLLGVNEWLPFAQNSYGLAMFDHPQRNCLYREGEACIHMHRGNPTRIREQLKYYKQEGMPEKYGLKEASVIVTCLSNPRAHLLLEKWWEEYVRSQSGRDQLALPYVLWKNNISCTQITSLGVDLSQDMHIIRGLHI